MDLSFIQLLWFILIGVLWVGYIALEGFGFGVGILLKGLARNEKERRASLNAIGPHWDGNEVWLITAGGATFAAFPEWYATMFSGMYLALVVILVCLIFRICALEWRKMINSPRWRNTWDWINATVCFVVSILWGVAFSNFVQGMKIEVGHYEDGVFQAVPADQVNTSLDAVDKHFLTGGFFSLLTPFTILGGVMMLALFISHGALFISIKTATGDFHNRAQALAKKSMGVAIILVVVLGPVGTAQLHEQRNLVAPARANCGCLRGRLDIHSERQRGQGLRCTLRGAGSGRRVHLVHDLPGRHEVLYRSGLLAHACSSLRHCTHANDHDHRGRGLRADHPRVHDLGVQGVRSEDQC